MPAGTNREINNIRRKGILSAIVGLFLFGKLPFLIYHDHIMTTVQESLKNDEGFKNGIKFLFGPEVAAKIHKLIAPHSLGELFRQLNNWLKDFAFLIEPYHATAILIKAVLNDTEKAGKPDLTAFSEAIEEDIAGFEEAHSEMKQKAMEVLEGNDIYDTFRLYKHKFYVNRIRELYQSQEVQDLLDIADSVKFNLRRIIKLIVLYIANIKLGEE